jgi:F-type H+-transporting ATPase subunit gamma
MDILGRKIAAAGDLEGVVRSMKALAASSLGQYERAVRALDDYYRTVELGLSECLRQTGTEPHEPARRPKVPASVVALVFGSDQGLVGRFNEMLADHVQAALGGKHGRLATWAVGERMRALLADQGLAPTRLFGVPTSVNGIAPLVEQVLVEIEAVREKGGPLEVHLFYNHPQPGAAYEPVGKLLLPIDRSWQQRLASLPWPTKSLPEVIGGATAALETFLRGYFFVVLFQACAESLASENASCLASMLRAEKNIEDTLEELRRSFHRLRQETIDEELFDVISGYEALAKGFKRAPEAYRPAIARSACRWQSAS